MNAKRIPQRTTDRFGLCALLQESPVKSDQPDETVTLIPMGAARLRISAFPTIGSGSDAHVWKARVKPRAPRYKTTASHCHASDSIDAVADGMEPESSGDASIPRLTWWDLRGTTEWIQYDFPESREISGSEVYWFDDTGKGQCRAPKSWHIFYQENGKWIPVMDAEASPVAKDTWNRIHFAPVKTTAIRLEAELQSKFSGGVLEWKIQPETE